MVQGRRNCVAWCRVGGIVLMVHGRRNCVAWCMVGGIVLRGAG